MTSLQSGDYFFVIILELLQVIKLRGEILYYTSQKDLIQLEETQLE